MVVFEGPLLINYVTRFSDDILTVLIAFMYIYDSIKYLKRVSWWFVCHCCWWTIWRCSCNIQWWKRAVIAISLVGLLQLIISRRYLNQIRHLYVVCWCSVLVSVSVQTQYWVFILLTDDHTSIYVEHNRSSIIVSVAFVMRSIRFSKYFGRQFRMVIGDLGLTIAIIVWILFILFNLRLLCKFITVYNSSRGGDD